MAEEPWRPRGWAELGDCILRAHVGPDHAAPLLRLIRLVLYLLRHRTRGRFGHHLDDVALKVHLPAVIQTTQTAVLVAAVNQRNASVRTVFVHHANAPLRVAEDHQVLAEDPRLDRRPIRLAHLFDKADWRPVPAHELPHWSIAFHPAQQIVFLDCQHGSSPGGIRRYIAKVESLY
jgi:hypothetical protein